MIIKVNNCGDCIFRESDFNPDSVGYDTVDSCILLKNVAQNTNKEYFIGAYNTFEEYEQECLKKRLLNCPLDKEQIIVTL